MADLYAVKESFTVDVKGVPTAYRKGELVDPDDPIVKSQQANLEPFTFPHPVKRSVEQATAAPGEKRHR